MLRVMLLALTMTCVLIVNLSAGESVVNQPDELDSLVMNDEKQLNQNKQELSVIQSKIAKLDSSITKSYSNIAKLDSSIKKLREQNIISEQNIAKKEQNIAKKEQNIAKKEQNIAKKEQNIAKLHEFGICLEIISEFLKSKQNDIPLIKSKIAFLEDNISFIERIFGETECIMIKDIIAVAKTKLAAP